MDQCKPITLFMEFNQFNKKREELEEAAKSERKAHSDIQDARCVSTFIFDDDRLWRAKIETNLFFLLLPIFSSVSIRTHMSKSIAHTDTHFLCYYFGKVIIKIITFYETIAQSIKTDDRWHVWGVRFNLKWLYSILWWWWLYDTHISIYLSIYFDAYPQFNMKNFT